MKSFSFKTKLYIYATYLAGFAILAWHVKRMDIYQSWLIITLCVLSSLSLILKVEGSTNRSHYSFNFLVYGFTFAVLGTSEAIFVILVSNLVEWIWNKPPWFIQLFNTACYILVMQLAGLVSSLVNPSLATDTWQAALGILLGMAAFNVLNHLLVGIVIWLARGESFKQSGIFEFFPLMLDLALLTFGASLSFVWNYNAFALALFFVPIYLIYSTLRVPALERKTEVDGKTGLFNHEYFKKHLNNELVRANRFDRPLAVILADLDLLRNINNTYGHLAGDEVLIGIAHAMRKALRDYDLVCRFGGEEFAILLPETTLAQAFERAEILRKTVESMEFTVPTSVSPIRATLSLGVAHRESFSQFQEEIIHNADLALYHSKLSGRNRCYAFTNESYVDFSAGNPEPVPAAASAYVMPETVNSSRSDSQRIQGVEAGPVDASVRPSPKAASVPPEPPAENKSAPVFRYTVGAFIGGLAVLAILALIAITRWAPFNTDPRSFDWLGLIVIAMMIVLSEGFSIDLYVSKTSVSTSAIPILVAFLIFGTTGIVFASLVLALSLLVKYRSQFSRFVFNLSNHVLSGVLVFGSVLLTGDSFLTLPIVNQIGISLVSAAILYLATTWMIALGMGLSLNQPASQIWKEQFSWLAPYYLGIGLITYALIFGYGHHHVIGLLIMAVPMVLLRFSQKQYLDRTREVVTELREKNQILQKNSEEISELNEGLLVTLSEIIDLRDPYVLGHSKQVSRYAAEIAKILGLNEKQVDLIRRAGLLHDIGKLGVPMEILTKPGKLTAAEYEIIKNHAALGGDLVTSSPSLRPLASIIRHHHEFFDGAGYPDQLAGNQIAIEARIISVSDAIEAMISDRPYRRASKIGKIMEELQRCSGNQFDPLVVKAAIQILANQMKSELSNSSNQSATILNFGRSVQVS
jgi:diguanylate cyclase (GGDEF)-like protein/putative nucleotidyltransferase with HDIG domain